MTDQLSLDGPDPEISPVRVRALAGVLAGFRWPDRGSFEKLRKSQQDAALRSAAATLSILSREPD